MAKYFPANHKSTSSHDIILCNKPCSSYSISLLIGAWEIWMKFYINNCQDSFSNGWLRYLCEIAIRRMSLYLILNLMSTLVQVIGWCHHATSNYLSQCWPRSMTQNGVTGPNYIILVHRSGSSLDNSLTQKAIILIAMCWPCLSSESNAYALKFQSPLH